MIVAKGGLEFNHLNISVPIALGSEHRRGTSDQWGAKCLHKLAEPSHGQMLEDYQEMIPCLTTLNNNNNKYVSGELKYLVEHINLG